MDSQTTSGSSLHGCLTAAIDVLRHTMDSLDPARVEAAVDAVATALGANKALLVCGNGGSASDAQHITGELVGRFLKERRGLKAICLSSNAAVLTAWSNDYSYDSVFARQTEAYGEPGGVLLGISTSGNSRNVIAAFEVAKRLGMTTIAMTGEGGGKLAGMSDVLLDVPSRSTPLIQQVHICLYHYLCEQVEARLA
ncbi:D-sedoheptulose 7-phosphate isomerase [Azospirillum lipoferum]|uniref:Phosphoheptose isomerase n=1 Tax=Azospirillum lipoferum TaxID=193 RepID=A0A5A9GH44_AZOLI|nr:MULTISPECIES: SIS domain-containing protein [Azospirillum]KAA0593720.1 SIS domain-containing protein [Azospirillum lipoferum]MCP1615018.1 D-sedoheptulose 7-phosphate isomerase [Azospirillum lipoferum]MDW5536923.1 SIS domain-containing protein [Azospirillum sp. NL1]